MMYDLTQLTAKHTYREGDANSLTDGMGNLASDYKRRVTSSFAGISGKDIAGKIRGDVHIVTRKIDGELQALAFDGTSAVVVNTGGRARSGLLCITEAVSLVAAAGYKECCFAAELHVDSKGQRGRIFDVAAALGEKGDADALNLAVFDVISINEKPFLGSYAEALELIDKVFGKGKQVQPIPHKNSSSAEVAELFDEWVVKGGAEGLVVRSDSPISFKIKQILTLDMVVIGFSVRDDGSGIRELQLALIDDQNHFRVVGVTGNGMSDKDREHLLAILSPLGTVSEQVATDSRRIAFRPVKPEIVVEVSCNDLLTETTKGSIRIPCQSWSGERYTAHSLVPGVSLIHPLFVRQRNDKNAVVSGAGFSQVTAIVQLGYDKVSTCADLPKSDVVFREVYCKKGKDGDMVQKFMAWRTNKNEIDKKFPAYVFHYTNYNPGRAEPLKREIRVSSSEEQIMGFVKAYVKENVKKGWDNV